MNISASPYVIYRLLFSYDISPKKAMELYSSREIISRKLENLNTYSGPESEYLTYCVMAALILRAQAGSNLDSPLDSLAFISRYVIFDKPSFFKRLFQFISGR